MKTHALINPRMTLARLPEPSSALQRVATKNYQKSNVNNRPRPTVGGHPQRWVSGAGPAPTSWHNAQRNYERYLALARAEAQTATQSPRKTTTSTPTLFRLMSSEKAK